MKDILRGVVAAIVIVAFVFFVLPIVRFVKDQNYF